MTAALTQEEDEPPKDQNGQPAETRKHLAHKDFAIRYEATLKQGAFLKGLERSCP